MNDIIKQLEPQCWEHNEFGLNFNYQKFAEMIVKECALTAGLMEHEGRRGIGAQILEHFGVEE